MHISTRAHGCVCSAGVRHTIRPNSKSRQRRKPVHSSSTHAPKHTWPRTVFSDLMGGMHLRTLTFSSRRSVASRDTGFSMATMLSTWSRWFWRMSRMMPNSSKYPPRPCVPNGCWVGSRARAQSCVSERLAEMSAFRHQPVQGVRRPMPDEQACTQFSAAGTTERKGDARKPHTCNKIYWLHSP